MRSRGGVVGGVGRVRMRRTLVVVVVSLVVLACLV